MLKTYKHELLRLNVQTCQHAVFDKLNEYNSLLFPLLSSLVFKHVKCYFEPFLCKVIGTAIVTDNIVLEHHGLENTMVSSSSTCVKEHVIAETSQHF